MSLSISSPSRWYMNRPADECRDSLAQVIAECEAEERTAREWTRPLSDLSIVPHGDGIAINGKASQSHLTHWAFGQLAGMACAPAQFLRELRPETTCRVLTERLADRKPEAKLLAVPTADGFLVKSVTSPTYGRIWVSKFVRSLAEAVDRFRDRTGVTLAPAPSWRGTVSLWLSDRDFRGFLISGGSIVGAGGTMIAGPRDAKGRDRNQNLGILAKTSEVGAGAAELASFTFDQVCGNYQIWGAQNFKSLKVRHTSGGPDRWMAEIDNALDSPVDALGMERKVKASATYMLPAAEDELQEWVRGRGFSKAETLEAIRYAREEEGDCRTLWQLVQGLTASARDLAHKDAMSDLSKRATALYDLAV